MAYFLYEIYFKDISSTQLEGLDFFAFEGILSDITATGPVCLKCIFFCSLFLENIRLFSYIFFLADVVKWLNAAEN